MITSDTSKLRLGIVTIYKSGKTGRQVYVIVDCEPRTAERSNEIVAEFEADWKGSIAKYNIEIQFLLLPLRQRPESCM